ncbi:MAG: DUF1552 domain-containing protein [Minicystis sp.]
MKRNVLDRRTVLRGLVGGAAAAVGLPLLDAMLNSNGTALANGNPLPVRLMTWCFGNGVVLNRWVPGGIRTPVTGPNYPISPELAPFTPVIDYVSVASGFGNKCHYTITHHEGMTIFSGHSMADIGKGQGIYSNARGPTIDQVAAKKIGQFTAIPSVQMGVVSQISMADYGTTMHNLSHKDYLQPLPPIKNPQTIYQSFVDLFTPPEDPSKPVRLGVADAVLEDFKELKQKLGANDKIRMDAHMEGLSELEAKIKSLPPVCGLPNQPLETTDVVDGITKINQAMSDLIAFAFACDVTRIGSLLFVGGASEAAYTEIGLSSQHTISHGFSTNAVGTGPYTESGKVDQMHQGVVYTMQQLAYLANKLKSTPDGAGSNLLDNSVIFASSDCAEGFNHGLKDQPMLIIGRAGGKLKYPGIHYRAQNYRNASDVLLTVLNAVVPEVTEVGSLLPQYQLSDGPDPAYSNTPLVELQA